MNNFYPQKITENGTITALKVSKKSSDNSYSVLVNFKTNNNKIDTLIEIPCSILQNRLKLLNQIPEGYCFSKSEEKGAYSTLKELISTAINTLPDTLNLKQGHTQLPDGTYVYSMANVVINKPENIQAEPLNPKKLTFTHAYSDKDSEIKWVLKYISQGKHCAASFLTINSSYISPILHKAGLLPNNTYSYGDSGTGKTEQTLLLTDIYDKKVSYTLSSDEEILFKAISSSKDEPCFIDDLNKTDSPQQKYNLEKKLSYIIHSKSSGGNTIKKGMQLDSTHTGIVITAEYLLNNPSTLNRCVLIHFEEEFDTAILTELQKQKAYYKNFLYRFIEWICKNMETLKSIATMSHIDIPWLNNTHNAIGYKRIISSYKTMYLTKQIMLMFFKGEYGLSDEEQESINNLFTNATELTVQDTIDNCIKKQNPEEQKILDIVIDALLVPNNKLVAKSHKKYLEKPHKVFFKSGKYLCYSGKRFVGFLETQNVYTSAKAISKLLNENAFLKPSGSEFTYKLSKKYNDNCKYYRIPLKKADELEDMFSFSNSIPKDYDIDLDTRRNNYDD